MPTQEPPQPAGGLGEPASYTWGDSTPPWARRMHNTLNRILNNQERQMAAIDDINREFTSLKDAVTELLQDLKTQAATAGGIGPEDVQSVIDQLRSTHDQIIAGLPSKVPSATPPAPATPPTTP